MDFEIAILGGGCIGAGILHELLRKGHRNVVLIDDGRKTLSATANSGGMLRIFHESLEHIDLALETHKTLATMEADGIFTERPSPNGSLYFFDRDRFPSYQAGFQRMDAAKYPFEILTPTQGKSRFPQFRWDVKDWAVFEPEASQRRPALFVDDLLSEATRLGATIFDSLEVKRLCRHADRYRLCTGTSAMTARWLILAGGARMLPRLGDLGVSLPLESKTLSFSSAEKKDPALVLPNFFDRETLAFGRLGAGSHLGLSDPQTSRLLEKVWCGPLSQLSAVDSYAPNRAGLLGQIPGHPRLLVASGWGGTAFKFSLEIGRRVARLVDLNSQERSYFHA